MSLAVAYQWHFEVILGYLPDLLKGLILTINLSALSLALALVTGLLVALARLSRMRLLRNVAYAYIELFRNTPLLMQIVWVYYALPIFVGVTLTPFHTGVVALSLNLTAFLAEIYRAGITSIGQGQHDAGRSIGMSRGQLYRRIILPQAIARIIPPLGSIWVGLFKDTSILSVIGVAELMQAGRIIAVEIYRPLEIFTAVALLYYLFAYPQSLLVNQFYHHYRVRE